jgi:hypothetical protein
MFSVPVEAYVTSPHKWPAALKRAEALLGGYQALIKLEPPHQPGKINARLFSLESAADRMDRTIRWFNGEPLERQPV